MEKALGTSADALILDLEDAVAPSAKPEARRQVATFVAAHPEASLWVRVNPLDGTETDRDLDAVVAAHPKGIVLPKAEGGASVTELARRLTERGNATAQILAIATETPAAMFQLGTYGGAKRLAGLTWGAEDLPAAIGAATSREEDGRYTPPYELARSLCLFGAAEIAHARAVVAAFEASPGAGALSLDGRMIDRPHLVQARRTLSAASAGDGTA
jgi:citrate lyase subunit beta/citryl-CoA lyase